MDHTKWLLFVVSEAYQLTLKLNHSHSNHLIVVKTWKEVVASVLSSLVKKTIEKSLRHYSLLFHFWQSVKRGGEYRCPIFNHIKTRQKSFRGADVKDGASLQTRTLFSNNLIRLTISGSACWLCLNIRLLLVVY